VEKGELGSWEAGKPGRSWQEAETIKKNRFGYLFVPLHYAELAAEPPNSGFDV